MHVIYMEIPGRRFARGGGGNVTQASRVVEKWRVFHSPEKLFKCKRPAEKTLRHKSKEPGEMASRVIISDAACRHIPDSLQLLVRVEADESCGVCQGERKLRQLCLIKARDMFCFLSQEAAAKLDCLAVA